MAVQRQKMSSLKTLNQGVEGIITFTGMQSQTVTLSEGDSNSFFMNIVPTSLEHLHVVFEWTIWIGSVGDQNNFPDGSNVNPSQWIIIPFLNDLVSSGDAQMSGKIYVKNVSAGGGQTVILEYRATVIQNSLTTGATIS